MPQNRTINRRFVLAERPRGEPTAATLRLETSVVPAPGPGQMLLRTEYLSLDPYMRGRMSDAPSYAAPVAVGGVMEGGTVAQVVVSDVRGFGPGDRVLSYNGWQDYALSDGAGVTLLEPGLAHSSWALGILGMPGFTAWAGLTQIGLPKAGETVCVAAWLAEGKMQYREEVIDGLEAAPRALICLLRGENFGKRVIQVGPASPPD